MLRSRNRPLFNRKYLVALVWLLPVIVLALNSDLFDRPALTGVEVLDDQTAWIAVEDDQPEALSFFIPLGTGIEGIADTEQGFFADALQQHLASPEMSALLQQSGVDARIESLTSYTKLSLFAADQLPSDLSQLSTALFELPDIDWGDLSSRYMAEHHVRKNDPQRQIFSTLLDAQPVTLNRSYYESIVSKPRARVIQSEQPPDNPGASASANPLPLPIAARGERSLELRIDQPRSLRLWIAPAAQTLDEYLARQVLGYLLIERISNQPQARWIQQLSLHQSLGILELEGDAVDNGWPDLLQNQLDESEIEDATQNFRRRWESFIDDYREDWIGIMLLAGLPPRSIEETLNALSDPSNPMILQLWEALKRSPDIQLNVRPLG